MSLSSNQAVGPVRCMRQGGGRLGGSITNDGVFAGG